MAQNQKEQNPKTFLSPSQCACMSLQHGAPCPEECSAVVTMGTAEVPTLPTCWLGFIVQKQRAARDTEPCNDCTSGERSARAVTRTFNEIPCNAFHLSIKKLSFLVFFPFSSLVSSFFLFNKKQETRNGAWARQHCARD